ncbi:MAG: outer membrane lipid asymmetry maintenance protein MlaD [Gammaproteobacteria bacterium]|nr:outer membrane lipid asymmetry maintenance protein MlaD [Gammaproteobacteria bacterium]NBT44175.1 outer membrane lipid asymmetry maintenance protein MlaD [Gammaproteobacteria bacterium]NBY22766.1 outer membrane lipid asymmetry maintenance protein MlaD [Gammaproteobacteria bacterium]
MQASKMLEIWVGVFVALGLLGLFFVAMEVSNLGEFRSAEGSYRIKAHFGNIGGLRVRAPVSMAGVTVGRVERIGFDEQRYEAVVDIRVDPAFKKLPEDTSASILTAGLLGEQYIGLSPGGSDVYLGEGDEIELTQSALVLEQLISRFLFNKAEEGKGDPKAGSPSAADRTEGPEVKGESMTEAPPLAVGKPSHAAAQTSAHHPSAVKITTKPVAKLALKDKIASKSPHSKVAPASNRR